MGTGTSSGRASAATGNIGSQITNTAINSNGNGTWSFDIDGVGGGQILDETGGSRDPMLGRGGKVYSITAWDGDYTQIGTVELIISGTLNEAKQRLKDKLKQHHGLMG